MSTCTCPDCLGFDPLNPAEQDRAAERGADYRMPEEIVVCGHKQAPWIPPCGCS